MIRRLARSFHWPSGKSSRGFTIVELLIVIVIIAILAAITVVSFNGVQRRARDNARTTAVSQIRKALETYKAQEGRYPAHIGVGTSGTNVPTGFSGIWGTSYSHSVVTDGSWMRNLINVTPKIVNSVPVDPTNDNGHYFTYWSAMSYGACREPFYVLAVTGYEDSNNIPGDSKALNCTNPDGSSAAHWTTTSTRAVFSNIAR